MFDHLVLVEVLERQRNSSSAILPVPYTLHPKRPGQPVDLSLADPKPMRTIGVLWRKEHPPSRATAEFLRLLRKACGVAEV